ncbi:MAG: fumarylacetoacetase, partial [Microbacterium sp.]
SQTVVVSETPIVRPHGQVKSADADSPHFSATARLDIECELGFVVGGSSVLGQPVAVGDAASHIFGVVILNDWSARDIQAWEYVPLGPFLGKSFATSISPWVVPMAALDQARLPVTAQEPRPLPYLAGEGDDGAGRGIDIAFDVAWNGTTVSRPNYRDMYWTPEQMLAHMTVNGASLRPGDLFGSGTISGPVRETTGSFLELSEGGRTPIVLGDGSERSFLLDGDTIEITASAPGRDGRRVGLGSCIGTVVACPDSSESVAGSRGDQPL